MTRPVANHGDKIQEIAINSRERTEFLDITPQVKEIVRASGITRGLCVVYLPHTTAGLLINEGADPNLLTDLTKVLARLVPPTPEVGPYLHEDDNADAHIKSALCRSSETILIEAGRLVLGTWQAIFLCEFDGPRERRLLVRLLADAHADAHEG